MIKKHLGISAFAAAILTAFTACGEVVQQASYTENGISENESLSDSYAAVATTIETTTEPVPTEPATMPIIKPQEYELPDSCVLDVECIMQKPELPTGCEVTSLAIALNYHGFNIDKVELCDNFLFQDYFALYTFEEAYVGDPKANNGYGCYAPVIVETAEKYFDSIGAQWYGVDLSDTDFRDLFYQIEQGRPVVIWTSMDMRDTQLTFRWSTEDGDEAWFADLEHCMVLTGYDTTQGIVYAADPLNGNVTYPLERFEECYEMLNRRAVVLCEGNSDEINAEPEATEAVQW